MCYFIFKKGFLITIPNYRNRNKVTIVNRCSLLNSQFPMCLLLIEVKILIYSVIPFNHETMKVFLIKFSSVLLLFYFDMQ